MSFEKPITKSTAESAKEKPKDFSQETASGADTGKSKENNSQENTGKISSLLNFKNREFLGKMSKNGQKIAKQIYEGLYKIPGVNRVVGKLEIAYNQFWADRHEEKMVGFKNKMDDMELKIQTLEQLKKEVESSVSDLKQLNLSDVNLQLEIRNIDRQKIDLLNEKDKIQSKFEARENKTKLYINARDRVANKLIENYNEKLDPMEKELENLQTCKDQVDLIIVVTEAKHKEQILNLRSVEEKKAEIEETLRRIGKSEEEIRKFESIKMYEKLLNQGYNSIKKEKENLTRKKDEINAKIAKVDAKANSYRDKREEFSRIKEGRPLKIDVSTRTRGTEFKGTEETKSRAREEKSRPKPANNVYEKKYSTETREVNKEQPQILNYLFQWNSHLQEKYGQKIPEIVNLKDFLKSTNLLAEDRLDFEDFKNILAKYYKFRKISLNKLNESIDNFLRIE